MITQEQYDDIMGHLQEIERTLLGVPEHLEFAQGITQYWINQHFLMGYAGAKREAAMGAALIGMASMVAYLAQDKMGEEMAMIMIKNPLLGIAEITDAIAEMLP